MAEAAGGAASVTHEGITYLSKAGARALDDDLLGEAGRFESSALIELAGLSVAHAVEASFPAAEHKRVLVVVGGGFNGADGLVAARHLAHMAYEVQVWVVKEPREGELFDALVHQARGVDVDITLGVAHPVAMDAFDVIVDSVFGFSFVPPLRDPIAPVVASMAAAAAPVVAVDVPSGWDVEEGDPGIGYSPALLVSLTLPKLCALSFTGKHVVGGRFVPRGIAEKHGLALPAYAGSALLAVISDGSSAAAI